MSLEQIGGALVGETVSDLLITVLDAKDKALSFNPCLERLKSTLESVIPKVAEMKRLDQARGSDHRQRPELKKLVHALREGKLLIKSCSEVKSWDFYSKKKYSEKILELDSYLFRCFQVDVQAAIWCDVGQLLVSIHKVDQMLDLLAAEKGISSISINSDSTENPVQIQHSSSRDVIRGGLVNDVFRDRGEGGVATISPMASTSTCCPYMDSTGSNRYIAEVLKINYQSGKPRKAKTRMRKFGFSFLMQSWRLENRRTTVPPTTLKFQWVT